MTAKEAEPAEQTIWAVIPAYNEAATIREVAGKTLQQLAQVIVVDDGSADGTAEALTGLPLTLLRNAGNSGKAASLWRGFQHALANGATGVITLDGDGQHSPEDIPALLAAARQAPGRMILGIRERAQRRLAPARYRANCFADFWISWAAGYRLEDSQSGFRLYPAEVLKTVAIAHDKAHSFVFESEILIEAARQAYYALAVPIGTHARPGARHSHFRPVLDIARITRMVAWSLISRGLFLEGLYRSLAKPETDWAVNARNGIDRRAG
jgi:glycosyltransferase involved in cell wall biosynthesis